MALAGAENRSSAQLDSPWYTAAIGESKYRNQTSGARVRDQLNLKRCGLVMEVNGFLRKGLVLLSIGRFSFFLLRQVTGWASFVFGLQRIVFLTGQLALGHELPRELFNRRARWKRCRHTSYRGTLHASHLLLVQSTPIGFGIPVGRFGFEHRTSVPRMPASKSPPWLKVTMSGGFTLRKNLIQPMPLPGTLLLSSPLARFS